MAPRQQPRWLCLWGRNANTTSPHGCTFMIRIGSGGAVPVPFYPKSSVPVVRSLGRADRDASNSSLGVSHKSFSVEQRLSAVQRRSRRYRNQNRSSPTGLQTCRADCRSPLNFEPPLPSASMPVPKMRAQTLNQPLASLLFENLSAREIWLPIHNPQQDAQAFPVRHPPANWQRAEFLPPSCDSASPNS